MIASKQSTEPFFERHAWKVFLGLSTILVLFGLGDMNAGGSTFQSDEVAMFQGITGLTWEQLGAASPNAVPMLDHQVRVGGAQLFVIGLLIIAVALTGFRRGERWAWYTMWVLPLYVALVVLLLLGAYKKSAPGIPPPLVSGPIFFVVTVLTLALSYRKYFSKGGQTSDRSHQTVSL